MINTLELAGIILSEPEPSHSTKLSVFLTFKLSVKRLSGVEDILDVIAPVPLYESAGVKCGDMVRICGELRSYNNKNSITNKLKINAWAQSIELWDGEYINYIELQGLICKPPIYRKTPYGREISDMILSVAREIQIISGIEHPPRYDYLPCIAWGSVARMCACLFAKNEIHVIGRFQSRKYTKIIDNVSCERTAYEISVSNAEVIQADIIADIPQ